MPSTSVIPFTFESHEVRVIERDGSPWWVLGDICRALEHSNPSQASVRLDADEKMTLTIGDSHSGQRGGAQLQTVVNESGLWSLVLTSRKPQAKTFKKWITSEVIPAIRTDGGYIAASEDDTDDQIMARALVVADRALARKDIRIAAQAVQIEHQQEAIPTSPVLPR